MLALAAGMCALAPPASAGGTAWEFDRPYYAPGDMLLAQAVIGWDDIDPSGATIGGPLGAWIAKRTPESLADETTTWAERIEWARYVADVRLELGPVGNVGPNHARVEFRVPPVEPGYYFVLTCNYPCTKPIGWITSGGFWVGPPQPDPPEPTSPATVALPPTTVTVPTTLPPTTLPPTTVAATRTAAAVDADLDGSDDGVLPLLLVVGFVAVVAGGGLAVRRLGGSSL